MSGIRPYMPFEINIACILFKQGSIVEPDVSLLLALNLNDLRNYFHIFTFYPIGVCVCVGGGGGGVNGYLGYFQKIGAKITHYTLKIWSLSFNETLIPDCIHRV